MKRDVRRVDSRSVDPAKISAAQASTGSQYRGNGILAYTTESKQHCFPIVEFKVRCLAAPPGGPSARTVASFAYDRPDLLDLPKKAFSGKECAPL